MLWRSRSAYHTHTCLSDAITALQLEPLHVSLISCPVLLKGERWHEVSIFPGLDVKTECSLAVIV